MRNIGGGSGALDRALSVGDDDDDQQNEALTEDETYLAIKYFSDFISAAFEGVGVLTQLRLRECQLTDDDFASLVHIICVRRSVFEQQHELNIRDVQHFDNSPYWCHQDRWQWSR